MQRTVCMVGETLQGEIEETINWEFYRIRCPECNSINIQKLNLFKGHYKKGNPLKKRNQQKYKCNDCGKEYWVEI